MIVVGLEEGHIPDWHATTADALQEELRVLHVMATRARKTLHFTYCGEPTVDRYGRSHPQEPSRWLPSLEEATAR